MTPGCGIRGSDKKSRKTFTEIDAVQFLSELRAHGFGEFTAQVVNGDIVRVKVAKTHEPIDG